MAALTGWTAMSPECGCGFKSSGPTASQGPLSCISGRFTTPKQSRSLTMTVQQLGPAESIPYVTPVRICWLVCRRVCFFGGVANCGLLSFPAAVSHSEP